MGIYSDILLTVDYDRTLTAPNGKIPERNLEAIRYFMENGGAFTLNTGRSTTTAKKLLNTLPVNAPFLLYNGSAAYEDGHLTQVIPIDLPMWELVLAVSEAFPELNVEIQGQDNHYLVNQKPEFAAFYDKMGWGHAEAIPGTDIGPFIKFSIYGGGRDLTLSSMFTATEDEVERFLEVGRFLEERWGDKLDIFYAAPRIMDVHAKGVDKGRAARTLQQRLGKKYLICVGDAPNDIPMLDAADFAYCPADAVLAERYENVCKCADGAVADVIYEKIPQILQIQP